LETDESNKHCQSQGYAGCYSQMLEHLLVFPASNLTAGSVTRISHTGIFITRINTGFQLFWEFTLVNQVVAFTMVNLQYVDESPLNCLLGNIAAR
jgi:hypothetical protein